MSGLHAMHALVARQSNVGSAQGDNGGSSTSAFLSTLIPTALISLAIFVVFLLVRQKYPRVYQPRSYLENLRNWQRSPAQSGGILGWKKEFTELKDEFVMGHASIDNYLWLRFFRMLALMCFVGCLITWPILFPVNATGGGEGTGLDVLSFSHINPGPRYYAQVFVAWIFLAWVCFLITRESRYYVRLSQQYFLSPYMSQRISTRTVLFVNVPEEARNEEHLRREYSGVKAVWLVNVPEDLAEKVKERDKAASKLENGEVKLVKTYIKNQIKRQKKIDKGKPVPEENGVVLPEKDRPTHRLPKFLKFLPFGVFGKKVDTVNWSRGELKRLVPEVATEQNKLRTDKTEPQAACFVEFETVQDAYNAMQGPAGKAAKAKSKAKMTPKELGAPPQEVIWGNIIKPFWKVKAFDAAGTAFIWFLCIFWTIPVAVIGAISNINYLTSEVPFLGFINDIPKVILGVVTGLLPVILLAVLMALVPIICNIIAGLFEPTRGSQQMKVQGWYFPFQVIQVFLVTTFASGASSVAAQIVQQPQTAPTLLAQNLPKASNFYISYFILQGLMTAALQFLNIVPLLFVLFLGKILDSTPRKLYNRYVTLAGLGWGSLYPKFTNLGVIALAYSCISPLILGFAAVGFTLLYFAFRFNALFTLGTNVSTRGQSYARALKQLTVGIYLSEICLIGLFAIGVASSTQSIGPLVLMIIFLVATILWHIWLNRSLKKLANTLPEHLLMDTQLARVDVEKGPNGGNKDSLDNGLIEKPYAAPNGTPKQGFMARIKGFFSPEAAADNTVLGMSHLLNTPGRAYSPKEQAEAYIHPAIISECPMVWIARDKFGLSKTEVADSRKEIGEGFEMTDEGAEFNEKGKVVWTEGNVREAPIWEDEPAY